MTKEKLDDKQYHFLLELFDCNLDKNIRDFLSKSELYVSQNLNFQGSSGVILTIMVDPDTYKIRQKSVQLFGQIISLKLSEISGLGIIDTKVLPDLAKYQYFHNQLVIVQTPWQEINEGQNRIIKDLQQATTTLDFQNVGNSSRTILKKLASAAYDPQKHTCNEPSVDLGAGSYKNRLHTIIRSELTGKQNKELREFALSLISTAEKSVDLCNKLTHNLDANRQMAEISAISTISTISTIKNTVKT